MSKARKRSSLKLDTIYYVEDSGQYIVTPDGRGVYVYDTAEEAEDQHGEDENIRSISRLADD